MTNKTPWPIIVLSLDGEDARRAPLLERLAALGLPFEVFIGIDGRKGLPPRWEAEIDRNAAHFFPFHQQKSFIWGSFCKGCGWAFGVGCPMLKET